MSLKPALKAKRESGLTPNFNFFRSRSRSSQPPQSGVVKTAGAMAGPFDSSSNSIIDSATTTDDYAPEGLQLQAVAAVGFDGFKTVLRLVERGSDIFPLLKSTAACLLGLIDLVEKTRQNPKDSAELEQHLSGIVNIVKLNQGASPSSRISLRLDGLSTAITHQMHFLQSKHSHGILRRGAEMTKDADDISACYRTISVLADRFLMETTFAVENIAQQNLDYTLLNSIPRAQYAAYDACGFARRNGCTENTRAAILARMMAWATTLSTTSIYWLNGMAGTGKTTISYSFSSLLECFGLLGATFFCTRRDDDCTKVNRIIPTIVYQLALRFPAVLESLPELLKHHPDVGNKTITRQFNDWLVPVLASASEERSNRPMVILIDALDECSDQEDVQIFLSKIAQLPLTLPVKFFVTSRPEQTLRKEFNRSVFSSLERFNLHDIEADIVRDDIRVYIKQRLNDISDGRSELQGSHDMWPPEVEVSTLVQQAGKLFIYAATACEYIDKRGDIRHRLTTVANTPAEAGMNQLDGLYKHILATAYEYASPIEKDDMVLVLRAVTSAPIALSAQSIGLLLNIDITRVWTALTSLHSVIYMPPSRDEHAIISTFHASFSDYLMDQERSGELFLNASESHHEMALHCLSVMNSDLRQNICCLEGRPENVDISPSTIKEYTCDALTFSCVYWTTHVRMAWEIRDNSNLHRQLDIFFSNHDLHWIEYLSLIGRLEAAVTSLTELERCTQRHPQSRFSSIIFDTRRFVIQNFDLIKHYCLETYHSALIWLPEGSWIRARYTERDRDLPRLLVGLQKSWSACELILECKGAVNSVAFSPDCSRVASASDKNIIQIWNAATGDLETILEGHTDSVNSVTFTPDGSHIISTSKDNTMRLWNITLGEVVFMKNGSNGTMLFVFSPDSSRIACISDDKTVRIWNTAIMCKQESILTGHTGVIESIAFSPDSRRIASASADMTVRVWNAVTGDLEALLAGHTNKVTSVVFSSDGSRIASSSADSTVRTWNTTIRESKASLGGVTLFMFLPESSLIVSASSEGTVLLWNAATGKLAATLEGHTDQVKSVVLSPDRSLIASTSDDKTVRIWSARTGQLRAILNGHNIDTVIFSPDNSHVVLVPSPALNHYPSASVEIWSVLTGHSEASLTVGKQLTSVEFSADSGWITIICDSRALIWNRTSKCALQGTVKEYSPDNSRFILESFDSSFREWNRATCNTGAVLKARGMCVFSPADSNCIMSISSYGPTRIWNAREDKLETVLEGLEGHRQLSRRYFHFSPDGSRLVFCLSDKILAWNMVLRKSDAICEAPKHTSYIVLSPDGRHVAVINDCPSHTSGQVQIQNLATGELEWVFKGHTSYIRMVLFSLDSSCIACASDKTVRVWNIVTGTSEVILEHNYPVLSVAFSPDGRRIATNDGTVRIWNAATGTSEAIFDEHNYKVYSVVFSLDGRYLVSAPQNLPSVMFVWDTATGGSANAHNGTILPDGSQVWLGDTIRVRRPEVSVDVIHAPMCKIIPKTIPIPISVSDDRKWVVRGGDPHFCAISPSYRNFTAVGCFGSLVCMGFQSGRVVILNTDSEKQVL